MLNRKKYFSHGVSDSITVVEEILCHMHPNVHCSTIYNSQDMEATQMPISRIYIVLTWITSLSIQ